MEKPVMRKARNTLRSVVTALVILGIIAVVGYAQKVVPLASKPVPTASVTGGIDGQGDPRAIRITFVDKSFGNEQGTFVSNPDYPPSLNVYTNVTSPGPKTQLLRYYYCDGPHDEGDLMCDVSEHNPYNYKSLDIYGGIAQKKSNQVVFPVGSHWKIGWKQTMSTIVEGDLKKAVIYELTR
jgi:hypothetical protein